MAVPRPEDAREQVSADLRGAVLVERIVPAPSERCVLPLGPLPRVGLEPDSENLYTRSGIDPELRCAGRHLSDSAARARRRQHQRAFLLDVAFAKQPGRSAITEHWVEPLEPCLNHLGRVTTFQEYRNLQSSAQTQPGHHCWVAQLSVCTVRTP